MSACYGGSSPARKSVLYNGTFRKHSYQRVINLEARHKTTSLLSSIVETIGPATVCWPNPSPRNLRRGRFVESPKTQFLT